MSETEAQARKDTGTLAERPSSLLRRATASRHDPCPPSIPSSLTASGVDGPVANGVDDPVASG